MYLDTHALDTPAISQQPAAWHFTWWTSKRSEWSLGQGLHTLTRSTLEEVCGRTGWIETAGPHTCSKLSPVEPRGRLASFSDTNTSASQPSLHSLFY